MQDNFNVLFSWERWSYQPNGGENTWKVGRVWKEKKIWVGKKIKKQKLENKKIIFFVFIQFSAPLQNFSSNYLCDKKIQGSEQFISSYY